MQLITQAKPELTAQLIDTKQFKTVYMHIRFIGDLDQKNVTARSLMLALMRAKNTHYPSRKQLAKACEMFYDTHFTSQALKLGTKHIVQFTFAFVHPNFIDDQQYKEDVLDFAKKLLHEPLFDEQTLKEEKQFLKDYFDAEYSNKSRYAYKRFSEHLYQGHPFNIHALGDVDKIDAVTLDDINESYQTMMHNNSVIMSVTGDQSDFFSIETLKERLDLKGQPLPKDFLYKHPINPLTPVRETMDVSQERLLVAYDTNTYFGDEDYFIALVFNSLFGDHSDSLLFQTIREKHSLAYYVHAGYSPFTGIITVMSGMDAVNIEKAKQMVDDILARVAQGDFKDETFVIAKTAIILSIKQSYDNPSSLSLKALRHALFATPFHEDYILKAIDNVSKNDVTIFAQKIKKLFTYQLGRDADANN